MTPLYLDIKDNVLQAGFEQILLKEDGLALTDDKSKAKCILSDHQKEADICPVLFLGHTPISIRDTLKKIKKMAAIAVHYKIGDSILNKNEKTILCADGQKMPLTDLEIDVLTYLIEQNETPCDKDALLKDVWKYQTDVTTHTVETHIYRLRQKLPFLQNHLQTVEDGYVLIQDIEKV